MKVHPELVKVAIARGGASAGEQIVTAIQVPDASQDAMKAFKHGIDSTASRWALDGKPATVGGKSVLTFTRKPPTYVSIVGDTSLRRRAGRAAAEEVLATLP